MRLRADDPILQKLTHKKKLFVAEYLRDFNVQRAGKAAGIRGVEVAEVFNDEGVQKVIDEALVQRINDSSVDEEWLMWELVDNHAIARQEGKLSASNNALGLLMKHVSVDAVAANRVDV